MQQALRTVRKYVADYKNWNIKSLNKVARQIRPIHVLQFQNEMNEQPKYKRIGLVCSYAWNELC